MLEPVSSDGPARECMYICNNASAERTTIMMGKRTLVAFTCTIIVLVIGVIVAVYFGLTMDNGSNELTEFQPIHDSKEAALSFFSQEDGLDIRWYSQADTSHKLQQAVLGDFMMVEGTVYLSDKPLDSNGSRVPVIGITSQSNLTLQDWIQEILSKEKKGIKLRFQNLDSVEPSLAIINSMNLLQRPVWLESNIFAGKGTDPIIDGQSFIETIQSSYPRGTLSLGWTTECCEGNYTQAMVAAMYERVKPLQTHVSFMIRASWLKDSLSSLRWLLKQSDRFSLTIWSPAIDWERASTYDLLQLRNDHSIDRIYYQLPEKKLASFRKLAVTAGSPLNAFQLRPRDALDVTWAHAVNSREVFINTLQLQSQIKMIEADIVLNVTDVPIMAHPPSNTSDLSFYDWVDGILLTYMGMKLDFKSLDSVNQCLKYLQSKSDMFHQPVWLNADVLVGPGGQPAINGPRFLRLVRNRFPQVTLSLGWTTGWDNDAENHQYYTQQNIDEMLTLIENVPQPVTFPIRAVMVRRSWPHLSLLLAKSRAFTLTIWSARTDRVDVNDLVYIRSRVDLERIYYDLPANLMTEFRSKI